jgi:hydroxylamine reductase
MDMFCFQCEQTYMGSGCIGVGQCGKDPESAALQDLIVHACKGLAQYAHRANALGAAVPAETNSFTLEALFSTLTNVNFDPERLGGIADELAAMRDRVRDLYETTARQKGVEPEALNGTATWKPEDDLADMVKQAAGLGVASRMKQLNEDLLSLQELITYGLKGLSAYAYHAEVLGQTDPKLYAFVHEALNFLTEEHSVDEYVGMSLKVGEFNLLAMELLDRANTSAYGHPVPTPVRVTPVKGKAIVVSGHDLKDLEVLLQQTEGKGINIYTHGEMLPAHGYPELKKYKHLVGNYGSAWQNQIKEFTDFPGAILMTTNCIQRPDNSYKARIFTCGPTAWPEVQHIEERDFSAVIEAALAGEGFTEDGPEQETMTGFGHNAVLGVADKIIDAVKAGAIKHFFLIGGCDGDKPGRNYFTEMAEAVPDDAVILTLGCGKYRFNKKDFGEIGGIPRLLDMGQCNDAYSAIQVAVALAKAFDTGVNELPLSLVLSWYEQKAVSILLTLLHLGIKNIRLGPSLPAFLSKAVAKVIVDNFDLKPIGKAPEDLAAMLG